MFQGEVSEGVSAKLSQAILALSVSTFIHDICVVFGFWGGFFTCFSIRDTVVLFDKENE